MTLKKTSYNQYKQEMANRLLMYLLFLMETKTIAGDLKKIFIWETHQNIQRKTEKIKK